MTQFFLSPSEAEVLELLPDSDDDSDVLASDALVSAFRFSYT